MHYDRAAVFSQGFKGLPDGWKELLPVTFVTGENSSGKTSLFDLVNIVDSMEFHFSNSILRIVDRLNFASDILSKFGSATEVTVGYLAVAREKLSDDRPAYIGKILTFVPDGELLALRQSTTFVGQTAIKIKRRSKTLVHRAFTPNEPVLNFESALQLAQQAHFDTSPGYSKIIGFDSQAFDPATDWMKAELSAQFQIAAAMSKAQNDSGSKKFRFSPSWLSQNPPFNSFRYGPIRSMVDRVYHNATKSELDPGGSHYPFKLKTLSDNSDSALSAIKKFGRDSGLFDDVKVVKLTGGGGAGAFSVMFDKFGKTFFADELGYGLGQIIPIVTDLLTAPDRRTFLIQQPEVHLHPRAQAAFGELLHSVAKHGLTLLIETHSDYLIDRFRISQSISEEKAEAQILFFDKSPTSDRPSFSAIKILGNGLLERPPLGYREFFVKESISVFEHL